MLTEWPTEAPTGRWRYVVGPDAFVDGTFDLLLNDEVLFIDDNGSWFCLDGFVHGERFEQI